MLRLGTFANPNLTLTLILSVALPLHFFAVGFLVLRLGTFRILSVDPDSTTAYVIYNHRETDERIFEALVDSVSTKVRNKHSRGHFLYYHRYHNSTHRLSCRTHPLSPVSRRYGRTVCTTTPSWTLYHILTSFISYSSLPPSPPLPPPLLCLVDMGVQSARPSHRGLFITCLYHTHPSLPFSLVFGRYGRTVCTTIPSWTLYHMLISYSSLPPTLSHLVSPRYGPTVCTTIPSWTLCHILTSSISYSSLPPLPTSLILCICLVDMGVQSARPSHRGLYVHNYIIHIILTPLHLPPFPLFPYVSQLWAYSLHDHPIVDSLRLARENYGDRLFIHPPFFVYSSALLRRIFKLPLPGAYHD